MSQTTSTAQRLAITWFEIPVADIERAQRFYETVLANPMRREHMGEHTLAVFAYTEPATGGCLMSGAGMAPAAAGTVVYLDASPELDGALARVSAAGGRVVLPRTELPEGMGCFAHIIDTEGNRVGLHAMR